MSVKRNVEVQQVAQMTKINAPYLTTKGSNVRSAPSTSGSKLAFLPAKTEFQAIGQAGDWIAVGRKGVLVGYISKDLVESKAAIQARIAASAPPEMQKSEVVIVPAVKLDKISAANEPEMAKLVDQPVVAEKVEATSTCKTLKSTVTDKDGKKNEATTELCKQPETNKWANA
ncbi:SH3 domain-containing protein [Pseudomonas sp. PhalM4]